MVGVACGGGVGAMPVVSLAVLLAIFRPNDLESRPRLWDVDRPLGVCMPFDFAFRPLKTTTSSLESDAAGEGARFAAFLPYELKSPSSLVSPKLSNMKDCGSCNAGCVL